MSTATIEAQEASTTKQLAIGSPYSLGMMSNGEIMALAAASPAGSADPVDAALGEALAANYGQHQVPVCDADDVDPATPDRKYSVSRVRDFVNSDGTTSDVVVMRGDLDSVLKAVRIGRQSKAVVRRSGNVALRDGWRPLAVATAPVDADDQVGDFTLQGYVAVTTNPDTARGAAENSTDAQWVCIPVWNAPLRFLHWSNVILIVTLSITGFYIMNPIVSATSTGTPTGFAMGWVRFIHFTAAFCWIVIGLLRLWLAFTSSNRFMRWSTLWPLKHKSDWRNLGDQLLHYVFVKKEAPVYVGHNPLAQLAYTGVYVLCIIQVILGLALFSLPFTNDNWFWHLLASPLNWWGISTLRILHVIAMIILWAFVIGHVYLVFRADAVERRSGLSSMINGNVWMKKGTKPVDAPMVE